MILEGKTIEISTKYELEAWLPDFYEDLCYDGSPKLENYIPTGVWFTLCEQSLATGSFASPSEGYEVAGVNGSSLQPPSVAGFINAEPLNNVMWNCHVYIYEKFRGNNSEQWAVQVADYLREHTGATKFLAITPYESAKHYAERAGFKLVGVLSNSIRKNGKLLNQYLLEL
jgi:hypothetical protein